MEYVDLVLAHEEAHAFDERVSDVMSDGFELAELHPITQRTNDSFPPLAEVKSVRFWADSTISAAARALADPQRTGLLIVMALCRRIAGIVQTK